jgi:hypothetical protein
MFVNKGIAIIREYPSGTIFKRKKDSDNMYIPEVVVSPDTIKELLVRSKMLHKKLYRLMGETELNDVDKDTLERTKREILGIAAKLQVPSGDLTRGNSNIKSYVILTKKVIKDLDRFDVLKGRPSDVKVRIDYDDFIKNYFIIV